MACLCADAVREAKDSGKLVSLNEVEVKAMRFASHNFDNAFKDRFDHNDIADKVGTLIDTAWDDSGGV